MRAPFDLPERHLADYEELVYQLRGYGAHNIANQLYWERTETEDGWALRGPWTPKETGYQQVSIQAQEHERLRKILDSSKFAYLHRLVAAMLAPVEPGSCTDTNAPTVNHVDNDILNQAPANLEAGVTRRENAGQHPTKGFCNKSHPIVGKNIAKNGNGNHMCQYCNLDRGRRRNHKVGRAKQFTPLPEFWTWMLSRYSDAPDPELAMYRDTGLLVPVVI